ncbi:PREDICTED: uncharacterized protein LOC109127713 [Camelina sativa]|uniref:Uncharacterized protein LOC109127713 n=1 Tax=Camelina sativa TaxID=90675 RepID=A0ABM1QPC8_CAMSA|nr:PREDICTED: uncharacterized protein LOC109127713 [Camelina sativa]
MQSPPIFTQNLFCFFSEFNTDLHLSMASSAAMFMLPYPLIQQLTRNNTPQQQGEPSSPQIVKCLLPAINSSGSSGRSKFSLWLFGNPATYDKRFQEAIELSCL